ncbi:hypothetical protein JCM3766R1_006649 [Sporobolomyces carnicolor]
MAKPRVSNAASTPRASQAAATAETSSLSSSTLVGSSDSPSIRSASSSSEGSDSDDSDSDSGSDTGDSAQEDEDEAEETLKLEQLLIKAKQSAREREQQAKGAKGAAARGGEGDGLAGNEEMVLFGDEDDNESDHEDDEDDNGTPKASTSKSIRLAPALVQPLSFSRSSATSTTELRATSSSDVKGKARAGPIALSQDLAGVLHSTATNAQGEKWGMAPVPRLSKKQYKANQPHTAGSKWFDMPATPMTPELKREIDAMRLRNALDPKKFMKGGAKSEKIGEFFQVGHVITPNTRATTSNSLPTASKRSFVEELVEDEQARAYAKKKTKEVMQKGMSGRKRQRQGPKGSYAMGLGGGKDGAGQAGGKRRKR